ncbi:MAG: MurR/RpiR family transcriptional regulator [Brotaphodocola sp.]
MKKRDISIITTIKQSYQRFTNVEKEIADFFLNNDEIMDFSAKNVSSIIFVSLPSLSRFAKKCGFAGYREFIYSYKKYLNQKKESLTGEMQDTLKTYEDIIKQMSVLQNRNQINRVLDMMHHKERVFVCGKGSSGLAAMEMEFRFIRIGLKITAITDDDRIRMQAVFLEPSDLVIGISISGTSESVNYLLKKGREKKAFTVLFTAYPREEMKEFCDEIIIVPALPNMDRGNLISPQFPILMMQDILYSQFKEYNQTQKEMLHHSTIRAIKNKKGEDNENL